MPAEKLQLKQIATQGGQPMVQAARSVVQALGPQAGDLFREVGGDAPQFATAGRVASWGGSPAFLQDFAERQELANDPATNKALELPTENSADSVANATLGTALSALPGIDASVRQAARQVFEVRGLQGNLDRKVDSGASQAVFARGLQEATGATFNGDVQYGGVGNYGSWWRGNSSKVLAPLAMRADGVGQALASLTPQDLASLPNPPVAGDLKTPIAPSQLQSAHLTSQGHGVYAVSLGDPSGPDPQWVRQPDGRRFTLDLNALEPVLRQRVPDLYKGGS